MTLLIVAHAFKKTLHPHLTIGVSWPRAGTIENADIRPKDEDTGVVLMHNRRELDKILHILRYRIEFTSRRVDEHIGGIANRPVSGRMIGNVSISTDAQVAVRIIHKINPVARDAGALRQRGKFREIVLNRP